MQQKHMKGIIKCKCGYVYINMQMCSSFGLVIFLKLHFKVNKGAVFK